MFFEVNLKLREKIVGRVLWSTPQPASPRSTSSSNLLARSRKAEQEKKKEKKEKVLLCSSGRKHRAQGSN